MRRETQNILLILVGGALLKISFTGAYLQYVKPAHQFWLIGGGAVMVALAVISIGRDLLAPRRVAAASPAAAGSDDRVHAVVGSDEAHAESSDHGHEAAAGHDHDADGHGGEDGTHNHPARSAWLLLLPVLAIFLIAPPALGADSVMRGDNRAAAGRAAGSDGMVAFSPLPAGSPVPVPMSEFAARAAWDSGNSLDNRDVQLAGFIVAQDADVYLARLSIACCAADAFPVKVKLTGDDVTGLTNDTWLQVVGRVQPGTATKENDYVPTLTVSSITEIPQPENPYEG
ncbi:TIGR03943 family putative permease subunit [Actinokineospora cianjurensis]|uniref:Putative repeat protein (TIGR03943 family) n=1 Tax=Actinokineospora cianjurensis TaxID=585224 RepID=A0A421AZG4_9PSEU|nr:TIGR03943 family protein [Actinokineospora cianjurensis]RLK55257.1 putative repeat protein (TIGR03943 family) [Actinokineospora cianjurensis]